MATAPTSSAPARAPAARPGGGIPPLVTWSLVTIGAWLIYASVKGLSPKAELFAALGGKPSPGPTPLSPLLTSLGATASDDTTPTNSSRQASVVAGTDQASMVRNRDGGPLLSPTSSAQFDLWERAYGRKIPADGWRSMQAQADGHAADPGRFADPTKSRHPKGQAVDVDLKALGANAGREAGSGNAEFNKLYSAAVATGWCNPRGPGRGDGREPWHFSYPGCG